jgi:hypothetical protein
MATLKKAAPTTSEKVAKLGFTASVSVFRENNLNFRIYVEKSRKQVSQYLECCTEIN